MSDSNSPASDTIFHVELHGGGSHSLNFSHTSEEIDGFQIPKGLREDISRLSQAFR